MQNDTKTSAKIFPVVSIIGALFVMTEIVLKFFGTSICPYEGCKMTAQYARFGDMSIFAAGLALFSLLAVLSLVNRSAQKLLTDRLMNLILIAALAGEGFFMGYLAFRIHTICIFCVVIFAFVSTLALLRILSGQKEVIAGFAAFIAVFSLQYLVLPAGVPVNLPNERLILFYSKDCKHCSEVLEELEQRHVTAAHLQVSEYAGFLKNMGIEHIPTLLVNDPFQKIFLTGKESIDRYLGACTPGTKPAGKPAEKAKPKSKSKTKTSTGSATAPVQGGASIDIFSQQGLLSGPAPTASPEGMCKEDEICK